MVDRMSERLPRNPHFRAWRFTATDCNDYWRVDAIHLEIGSAVGFERTREKAIAECEKEVARAITLHAMRSRP
jgi:hypothetical protein